MIYDVQEIKQFLQITSGKADIRVNDDVMFIIVADGQVVIEEMLFLDAHSPSRIEIDVKDGALLDYIAIQSGTNITVSRTARVEKNAMIRWFDVVLVEGDADVSTVTTLAGEGARGETYGVFFASGEESYRISHQMIHCVSHTTSDMKTKGLVGGKGYVDYAGLVKVPEGSYGCEGYQQEDSLLLSRDAKIHAVPDLEIANNDVKCSHGVTTTHINKEKLFYMQSRGLDTAIAKQLVVRAHVGAVLDGLMDEKKDAIFACVDKKFGDDRER